MAAILSLCVPGSRLENRGQRPFSSLVQKALKFRFSRVCTIHKEQGKPATIAFLSIDENGFEWLTPKLRIEKVAFLAAAERKTPQATMISIKGAKRAALQKLLSPINISEERTASITAGAKAISFSMGRKKMLTLGVKYAR